jgi:hypothetical protein
MGTSLWVSRFGASRTNPASNLPLRILSAAGTKKYPSGEGGVFLLEGRSGSARQMQIGELGSDGVERGDNRAGRA